MASEPDPCFRMLPALFFLFQTSIFSLVVSIERCAAQQIVCCQLSLHPGFWMSRRLGLCNACSSGRPACDESQSPIHSVMQPGAGTALAPANTYRCPPMEEDTSTKPWTVGFYVGRVGCTECCFCRDILVLWAWRFSSRPVLNGVKFLPGRAFGRAQLTCIRKGPNRKHTAKQLSPPNHPFKWKGNYLLVGPPSFLDSILVFPLCFFLLSTTVQQRPCRTFKTVVVVWGLTVVGNFWLGFKPI